MILKLNYAKFGDPNSFFSNVTEEKSLGGRLDPPPPPLVKEGLILVKIDPITNFQPKDIIKLLLCHTQSHKQSDNEEERLDLYHAM